eukprot:747952-Hanusia_phi.AAC.1
MHRSRAAPMIDDTESIPITFQVPFDADGTQVGRCTRQLAGGGSRSGTHGVGARGRVEQAEGNVVQPAAEPEAQREHMEIPEGRGAKRSPEQDRRHPARLHTGRDSGGWSRANEPFYKQSDGCGESILQQHA